MIPLIPVTDEQAKLGQAIVEQGGQLGRFLGRVFGTPLEDLVGLAIGDPLRHVRTVVALKYEDEVARIHARRGVRANTGVSPSVAIPLLTAACDETRPELQKIWAELLAAAMDPSRANRVRLSFIDTVKQMDPQDAVILSKRLAVSGQPSPNAYAYLAGQLGWSNDSIEVSVEHLVRLGCCTLMRTMASFDVTAYGRELMRACSDV